MAQSVNWKPKQCYVDKETFQKLAAEIGQIERRLKALIKSLENKHLAP